VASRYEIQAPLGAGGMGVVFRAHDRTLDETVALKVVRPARDQQTAQRFRSEIKLARRVRHRNVCAIHEYGEDGELAYISMEFLEGTDLKRTIEERGALPWEEAYDVVLQVAEGLRAIHEAGVIHRDLKPANVMRDPRGTVRVMDFGIAKLWGQENTAGLTGSGQVVGSPEHMSPEQARGRPLDFASDVYSLGVLAYEVFTGRVPFRRDSPVATMLAHLEEEPPLDGSVAAQLPHALVPVLRRALAKSPAERYPGCPELLAALRQARLGLAHQPTDAVFTPAGAPARAPRAQAPRPDVARLLREPLRRALAHADPAVRAGASAALGTMSANEPRGPLLLEPAPPRGFPEWLAHRGGLDSAKPDRFQKPVAGGYRWRSVVMGAAVVLAALVMLWLVAGR
jgi:serine/threonine protein kinase